MLVSVFWYKESLNIFREKSRFLLAGRFVLKDFFKDKSFIWYYLFLLKYDSDDNLAVFSVLLCRDCHKSQDNFCLPLRGGTATAILTLLTSLDIFELSTVLNVLFHIYISLLWSFFWIPRKDNIGQVVDQAQN